MRRARRGDAGARVDLNDDGLADAILEDRAGRRMLAVAQCGRDHVSVADVAGSGLAPAPTRSAGWRDLEMTRACIDAGGVARERRHTLRFDPARKSDGPPDGDPLLADACVGGDAARPAD